MYLLQNTVTCRGDSQTLHSSQQGEGWSGTFLRYRNPFRPIFPVDICVAREDCALCSPWFSDRNLPSGSQEISEVRLFLSRSHRRRQWWLVVARSSFFVVFQTSPLSALRPQSKGQVSGTGLAVVTWLKETLCLKTWETRSQALWMRSRWRWRRAEAAITRSVRIRSRGGNVGKSM